MIKISVITPLYKGKKYINTLKIMIESNAENVKDICFVEWIVVNDYPNDYIEKINQTDLISVVVINNSQNKGIQGARVTGLEACTGDYVLFLDQDDWISSNWIRSQCERIGDADAVVCSCTCDGRLFYGSTEYPSLEICITREYNLFRQIGFIPGQVMIKKTSIPKVWINNWLFWNCCDDYFLWICMYSEGCKFVGNENVLYDHRTTFSNQGMNSYVWYKSMMEMTELVKNNHLFSEIETNRFVKSRMLSIERDFLNYTWTTKKLGIYMDLLRIHEFNISFKDYFKENNICNIAIYGLTIGQHVYQRLEKEKVNIIGYIDRNAENLDIEIPVYKKEKIPKEVDTIINTLIRDEDEINNYIHSNYPQIKIIGIRDLLDGVIN